MSLEEKNKTYSTMRRDFMLNNKNPFGERTRDGGENSAGQKIIEKNIGGRTITTTETKVAEDKKEATLYDPRKTKKKGMTKNILTSKQGVMKTAADYSLGKKSLLGQVV